MTDYILVLCLLIGLELVLGVENVLVIAIFAGRLPENQRDRSRVIGLSLALLGKIWNHFPWGLPYWLNSSK